MLWIQDDRKTAESPDGKFALYDSSGPAFELEDNLCSKPVPDAA
jgi:hypothetical protein